MTVFLLVHAMQSLPTIIPRHARLSPIVRPRPLETMTAEAITKQAERHRFRRPIQLKVSTVVVVVVVAAQTGQAMNSYVECQPRKTIYQMRQRCRVRCPMITFTQIAIPALLMLPITTPAATSIAAQSTFIPVTLGVTVLITTNSAISPTTTQATSTVAFPSAPTAFIRAISTTATPTACTIIMPPTLITAIPAVSTIAQTVSTHHSSALTNKM